MPTILQRIEYRWERSYPLILGMIAFGISAWKLPEVMLFAKNSGWKIENIYSSSFNITTVATPFLFTFYTIFVTTENGFIGRMKRTYAYKMTVQYTLRAMWLGALFSIVTIPVVVANPVPLCIEDPWIWILSGWIGLFSATMASFVRAAMQFSIFISTHAER